MYISMVLTLLLGIAISMLSILEWAFNITKSKRRDLTRTYQFQVTLLEYVLSAVLTTLSVLYWVYFQEIQHFIFHLIYGNI